MKLTKKREVEYVTGIKCDCCKTEYSSEDVLEFQEIFRIHSHCGYGSLFGDGNTLEVDLCQYCMKKIVEANCGDITKYIKR